MVSEERNCLYSSEDSNKDHHYHINPDCHYAENIYPENRKETSVREARRMNLSPCSVCSK